MSTLESFLPKQERLGLAEYTRISHALNPVAELLGRAIQDPVIDFEWTNFHRQIILITQKGLRYQLVYKRRPFKSFGECFKEKEKYGMGESLNEEVVNEAIEKKVCGFIFVYPDTKVYFVSVEEIKEYAQKDGTVRTTLNTEEDTMSIPIKCLKRWK